MKTNLGIRLSLALFFSSTACSGFALERISKVPSGATANGDSRFCSISGDGNLVVYESRNSGLDPVDTTEGNYEVYLYRRDTGTNQLLSVDENGEPILLNSQRPIISSAGTHLVFLSVSTAFEPSVGTNGSQQVYMLDVATGDTRLVSKSTAGDASVDSVLSADLSSDGRYSVFDTYGGNLDAVDNNGTSDIYIHDRDAGANGVTELLSLPINGAASSGNSTTPSISNDGRYVFFISDVNNWTTGSASSQKNAFIYDRQALTFTRISNGQGMDAPVGDTTDGLIARDGEYAFFLSIASNITLDDSRGVIQAYRYHIPTGEVELVSKDSAGVAADEDVQEVACSDDGRFVVFNTNARDFSGDPDRFRYDVYLRDLDTGVTTRISERDDGVIAEAHSQGIAISGNGRYIGFNTESGNLAPPDLDGLVDVLNADNPVLKAAEEAAAAAARAAAIAAQKASQRLVLSKKIRKIKTKMKKAKKSGKVAKAKKLKKQFKKLTKQFRSI